eukprot:TRINITY_DN111637_c0_g1_i1.p1 TRINITY_DN111637_c0_g1~~TRINITY_DN111637_c0_g1_i1.p1  ORF type:complete len:741 (+),score=200.80 TRINITY_DN111637_c0_g1_i1:229-2451(+)
MSGYKGDKYAGNASPSPKQGSLSKMSGKNQPPRKEMRADFLLNFQRPPSYQRQQNNYAPPPRRSRPSARTHTAASLKGRFVQSSFRLFVEDEASPDVIDAAFDGDTMLNWETVRRVDLICEQQPKCPICLELELAVPKITRCGHLFCLPCIMRYFSTLKGYNGKVYQQCPVCKEQVCPDDLISARLEMAKTLREGSSMTFVLAQKDIGSALVGLANARIGSDSLGAQGRMFRLPYEGEPGWKHSRMILLRPDEAESIYIEELQELEIFRERCIEQGDTELVPSTTAAAELLQKLQKQRQAAAPQLRSPGAKDQRSAAGRKRVDSYGSASLGSEGVPEQEDEDLLPPPSLRIQGVAEEDDNDAEEGQFEDLSQSGGGTVPSTPNMGAASSSQSPSGPGPSTKSPGLGPSSSKGISFYQAHDGRPIFFQPFYTKLLLHEHGGRWDRLPLELPEIRLERISEDTVTEETRKRHKFLSHLPLGSTVSFCEVDLRPHLSRETKEFFAEDFAKRRQQRKKDEARNRNQERRSKARAEQEEERFYNSLDVRPSNMQALPTKEDFAATLDGRTEIPEDATGENGDAAEGIDEPEGPTLADKIKEKMASKKAKARQAKAQQEYFPELASGAASSSSAWGASKGSSRATSGNAWGKKVPGGEKTASSSATVEAPVKEEAPDSWEDIQDQPSFGEALEAALRKTSDSAGPGASTSAAAADKEQEAEASGSTAAAKKKKGRAGKATTIRLFG